MPDRRGTQSYPAAELHPGRLMPGYAYKWVSYTLNGEHDTYSQKRAVKRGWRPCPPAELPPIKALGLPHPDFRKSMRDFRLYRMPTEDHATMIAARPTTDQQLAAEFARFQTTLAALNAESGWDVQPIVLSISDGSVIEIEPEVKAIGAPD